MQAGVVGASGYLGAELLRLLASHPTLKISSVQADTSAGRPLAELYPGLSRAYEGVVLDAVDLDALGGCDVVFVAVPSGHSQAIVVDLCKKVPCVVDLGADFRLKAPDAYPKWYGFEHTAKELLKTSVFGLPELFREDLPGASLIAAPGCYVTAACLALAPFVRGGVVESTGIIVDAASGTSGGGRAPNEKFHHSTVNENFSAYGVLDHRHTPEIEQTIGAEVLFTPHLAPMTRGILATCYARPTGPTSTERLLTVLRDAYRDEPFVVVDEQLPSTRSVYGSNLARLTARYDERTGWVIVFSAIDNLTKGGAGQALQAANIALGIAETAGLPTVAVMP